MHFSSKQAPILIAISWILTDLTNNCIDFSSYCPLQILTYICSFTHLPLPHLILPISFPPSTPHPLIRAILTVFLSITEPFLQKTLVAVWAPELRQATRWFGTARLVRVVPAVSVAITVQTLWHTLPRGTPVLTRPAGLQTCRDKWKRGNLMHTCHWWYFSSSEGLGITWAQRLGDILLQVLRGCYSTCTN